jgi:hypothetical protein
MEVHKGDYPGSGYSKANNPSSCLFVCIAHWRRWVTKGPQLAGGLRQEGWLSYYFGLGPWHGGDPPFIAQGDTTEANQVPMFSSWPRAIEEPFVCNKEVHRG